MTHWSSFFPSCSHVNTTKIFNNTCTFAATSMILHGLNKGGKNNPTFSRPMHWVFDFNAKKKKLISANKTMDSFQHWALGSRHHHWRTLDPLPYNLNSSATKPNKTHVLLNLKWSRFWKKERKTNYEKPNCKKKTARYGANLGFRM